MQKKYCFCDDDPTASMVIEVPFENFIKSRKENCGLLSVTSCSGMPCLAKCTLSFVTSSKMVTEVIRRLTRKGQLQRIARAD